jgi:hypothetical protein
MSELFQSLLRDPMSYVEGRYDEGHAFSREQVEQLHLSGLRLRFGQLRGKVAVLDRLATEQGITQIDSLDDAVALLFPHTVYKSYPLSILERNQFDRLTRWLGGLTSVDLGGVDVSGVESIDAGSRGWTRKPICACCTPSAPPANCPSSRAWPDTGCSRPRSRQMRCATGTAPTAAPT